MKLRRLAQYLLAMLAAAFFILFLLLPVGGVVVHGCDARLLAEVFCNPVYVNALIHSLAIALTTTLLVAVITLPLAFWYDRYRFPGRDAVNLAMFLPMILPPFVGAIGFQQLLGYYGVVNSILAKCGMARIDFLAGSGSFWSICVIEALHLYPIFYLNIVTSFGNIDPNLEDAAANLGISPCRRFFSITLPLLRPGILAGGALVLIWSFTELGTPLMFNYTAVTPVQIFNGLTELESNPVPFALVAVTLAVSLALYLISRRLLAGGGAVAGKGNSVRTLETLPGLRRYVPTVAFSLLTLLAILPHLVLILIAFSRVYYRSVLPHGFTLAHFQEALSNALVLPSIGNSLRYSLIAMAIAMAIGVLTSLVSTRWRLKGGALTDFLAMTPLAVPGIVVAFGYLSMSVRFRWASAFNAVENPLILLSIAYAVRRIPYVVRAVSSGLEQTPVELEEAARNFGASPWRAFSRITLPLIFANMLVGGLFAFSFSMLEVSDSLILAQKSEFFPITRALYELSQILGSGNSIAAAFGVWTMLFLGATLGVATTLLGRKIGAVFKL